MSVKANRHQQRSEEVAVLTLSPNVKQHSVEAVLLNVGLLRQLEDVASQHREPWNLLCTFRQLQSLSQVLGRSVSLVLLLLRTPHHRRQPIFAVRLRICSLRHEQQVDRRHAIRCSGLKDPPRVLVAQHSIDELRLVLLESDHLFLVHAKVTLLDVLVVERVDTCALCILLLRKLVELAYKLGCLGMLPVQDGLFVVDGRHDRKGGNRREWCKVERDDIPPVENSRPYDWARPPSRVALTMQGPRVDQRAVTMAQLSSGAKQLFLDRHPLLPAQLSDVQAINRPVASAACPRA